MNASKLPFRQAVLWVVLGGIAAQLAGAFVSALLQGFLRARGAPPGSLAVSPAVMLPSIAVSGVSLAAIAWLAPSFAGVPRAAALGLRAAPPVCYGAAALGTVMLGPTADLLMRMMERAFPELSLEVLPALQSVVRGLPIAVSLPVFALLPGISEELMFRGLLQNAAGRGLFAISVSGIAFALFHVDPHHVAGVLPLGLFLAWVGSRCGTYVTIVAHVLNNAAAVLAVHSRTFDVGYGTAQEMPWQWVPISLGFVALSVVVIARATAGPRGLAHSTPPADGGDPADGDSGGR